jgi:hypothetical protein
VVAWVAVSVQGIVIVVVVAKGNKMREITN